jgi:hypothetical protein
LKGKNSAAVFGSIAAMYFVALGSEMIMDWYKYGGSENHPLIERMGNNSGDWASAPMAARAMNRWAVGGVGQMLLYDLWESGQYNGRGFADEGIIQDMMSGTVGKDVLRGAMLTFAMVNGLTGGGEPIRAEQVGAFFASMTPMMTALPRNDDSPASSIVMTKDDLAEYWTELFEEMGG